MNAAAARPLWVRLMIAFIIVLALLLGVLLGFYFWASSGRLDAEELLQHRRYKEAAPEAPKQFTVLSYNIGYLSGMNNNQAVGFDGELFVENLRSAVELLRLTDAQLLGIQEIDLNSARSGHVDQVDTLAGALDIAEASVAVNWDKRYVPFPYWPPSVHFGSMLSGQAVLSDFGIDSSERWVLQEVESEPFYYRAFYLDRIAQLVELQTQAGPLLVINVHLEAFDRETREKQAQALLERVRRERERPLLVMGDFNCVPPNAELQSAFPDEPETDFEGERSVSLFFEEGWLGEVLADSPHSEAQAHTFPADEVNRRLDYIFYHRDYFELVDAKTLSVARTPSDHLPVVATLRWKKD
ncbi:MAG: endonuclease/exonuclease/phosphatase family protein [Myxococcota bacterium]|jgi:endonuclease/exonuclease/phosphatase family metal-dependent hydrolase|nr:endonuclease/exonuclease/phosphatase family protein [Myxococcota bacterium]